MAQWILNTLKITHTKVKIKLARTSQLWFYLNSKSQGIQRKPCLNQKANLCNLGGFKIHFEIVIWGNNKTPASVFKGLKIWGMAVSLENINPASFSWTPLRKECWYEENTTQQPLKCQERKKLWWANTGGIHSQSENQNISDILIWFSRMLRSMSSSMFNELCSYRMMLGFLEC